MEPKNQVNKLFGDCAKKNNMLVGQGTPPACSDATFNGWKRLLETLKCLPKERNMPVLELAVFYNYSSIKIQKYPLDLEALSELEAECLAVLNRVQQGAEHSVWSGLRQVLTSTSCDLIFCLATMIYCLLTVCNICVGKNQVLEENGQFHKLFQKHFGSGKALSSISCSLDLNPCETFLMSDQDKLKSLAKWCNQLSSFVHILLKLKKGTIPTFALNNITDSELSPYTGLIRAFLSIHNKDTVAALQELKLFHRDGELAPEILAQVFSLSALCASNLAKYEHAIELYKEQIKLTGLECDILYNLSLQYRHVNRHEKELSLLNDLVNSVGHKSDRKLGCTNVEIKPSNVVLVQENHSQFNTTDCLYIQTARLCELGKCEQALEKWDDVIKQQDDHEELQGGHSAVDVIDLYTAAVTCASHSGRVEESWSLLRKLEELVASGSLDLPSQPISTNELESLIDPGEMLIASQSILASEGEHASSDLQKLKRKQINMARVLLLKAELQAGSEEIQESIQSIDSAISLIESSVEENSLESINKRERMENGAASKEDRSPCSDILLLAGAFATRSMLYAMRQQYSEAYRFSKKAVDLAPLDETRAYNHALLLLCLDDTKVAIEYWCQFRKILLPATPAAALHTAGKLQSRLQKESVFEHPSNTQRRNKVTNRDLIGLDIVILQRYGR